MINSQGFLQLPSLKLTWPIKMDGWNTKFLLGRPIFRGKPLVSGRVSGLRGFLFPPFFFDRWRWGFLKVYTTPSSWDTPIWAYRDKKLIKLHQIVMLLFLPLRQSWACPELRDLHEKTIEVNLIQKSPSWVSLKHQGGSLKNLSYQGEVTTIGPETILPCSDSSITFFQHPNTWPVFVSLEGVPSWFPNTWNHPYSYSGSWIIIFNKKNGCSSIHLTHLTPHFLVTKKMAPFSCP